MSSDSAQKQDAYSYVEEQLKKYSWINPAYILFHYPKPVILDESVDWSEWRILESEYCYQCNYSLDEFEQQSEELFIRLTLLGKEYNFTPVLEFGCYKRVFNKQ